MGTRLLILSFLWAVLMCNCTSPRYLPTVKEIDVNPYGSYITVSRLTGKEVSGELIAIDSSRLIVLPETATADSGCLKIPIREVKHFTVRYAHGMRYGWTIPAAVLVSLLHGGYAVITLPAGLAVSVAVTVSGANAFKYDNRTITYDRLKMFARFPQGIPQNVSLADIR